MDTWGKTNTIASLIAVIVITIILAYIGNIYIQTEKDKDVHQYIIKIALRILEQQPNKDNIDARKWAINTINFYSTVRIHRAAQEELLHKISLDQSLSSIVLEAVCKDSQRTLKN